MHYSKHYLTYTNNLNKAIVGTELEKLPIEEILAKSIANDSTGVRNNAGGYYNHSLFWKCMSPKAGGEPKDTLSMAIVKDFGSFENFKKQFKNTATKHFGSGWAWLIVDKTGKLQVTSTTNQDNPLMPKVEVSGKPILALDLWEHAYYLDYQYRRKNYIDSFFNIINWSEVEKNYEETLQ
jgi:Fe-Mn family superoxide dismutase